MTTALRATLETLATRSSTWYTFEIAREHFGQLVRADSPEHRQVAQALRQLARERVVERLGGTALPGYEAGSWRIL